MLAAIFAAMTLATGTLSVGAYCLTSDGADGRRIAIPAAAVAPAAAAAAAR